MSPGSNVEVRGFTNYSHLNPIDPAQYPSEGQVPPQELSRHRAEFEDLATATVREPGAHDRIVRIASEDWCDCFDRLSRSHQGWLASLVVSGAPTDGQVEARDLPFAGVAREPGSKAVLIRLGALVHSVGNASAVWLRVGPDGAEKALGIEATDANRTVLEFRSALPTEMVDGIAPFPADRR